MQPEHSHKHTHSQNEAKEDTLVLKPMPAGASMELNVFQGILDAMNAGIAIVSKNYTLLYSNAYLNSLLNGSQQAQPGEKIYANKDLKNTQLQEIHQHLEQHECWQGVFPQLGRGLKVVISRMHLAIPESLTELAEAYFMVTVSDYSDFIQKQQELVETENLALKSEKAKSEFLSHMSHELRTPLNAILGFTQLLKTEPDLSEIQQDNVAEILTASNHLLELINEILDLSKRKDAELTLFNETINLNDLFTECLALVKPLAQEAKVEITLHETGISLASDRVRLKQILLNLLSNAIKYNREGGQVAIQAFLLDSNNVRIEVLDSGKGIAASQLETIFKPFSRLGLDGSQKAGLGLMLTRRLVQHLKGNINVISAPGNGSIFSLEFPIGSLFFRKGHDQENTELFKTSRRILWVGENKEIKEFFNNFKLLRPTLDFHYSNSLSNADEQCEKLRPDLVFIKVEEPCLTLVNPSSDTKNFLKKVNAVAVINSRSFSIDKIDSSLKLTTCLRMPLQAIDFIKVIDSQLYRCTNGIA